MLTQVSVVGWRRQRAVALLSLVGYRICGRQQATGSDSWTDTLPLQLPPPLLACTLQAPAGAAPPASWEDYYALRGLPLESPAALVLHAVLTLSAAAARSLPQQRQQKDQEVCRQAPPLVLHLLGVRHEMDAWPLLLELGCLLPRGLHTRVHLVGPEVPDWAHGNCVTVEAAAPADAGGCGDPGCSCANQAAGVSTLVPAAAKGEVHHAGAGVGGMTLHFWRGAWHDLAAELARLGGFPHAVVAPNAGKPHPLSTIRGFQ